MYDLSGIAVGVLGGDRREVQLIKALRECGAQVNHYGVPDMPAECTRPEDVVVPSQVIILPLPGTDAQGNVRVCAKPIQITRSLLSLSSPGTLLLIGTIKPHLAQMCKELGISVIETAEDDEVAILNSIPSAEGAIQMAMEATDFTIHDSNSLVLGLGRTGLTVARMLKAIGAHVWTASRSPMDRARAFEMGFSPLAFTDLNAHIGHMDLVFNTVPAMIVDRTLICLMKRSACIIDLASAPGGVDFEAARESGIHAELAPGLPGKVAPLTAGRILAQTIPGIIYRALRD